MMIIVLNGHVEVLLCLGQDALHGRRNRKLEVLRFGKRADLRASMIDLSFEKIIDHCFVHSAGWDTVHQGVLREREKEKEKERGKEEQVIEEVNKQ